MRDYRIITVVTQEGDKDARIYLDGMRCEWPATVSKWGYPKDGVMMRVITIRAPYDRVPRRIAIMNIVALALSLLALTLSIIRMIGGAQ